MEKINNISCFAKTVFNIRIKLSVFFYFLKQFIMHKISFKKFIIILQRLLFFLSSLQHNKFVKIGNKIRMGLYIPGMSSPAFITAINKFAVFNEKLPNTTVLVSITSACRFKCEHCYQKNDKGKDLEIEKLLPVIKELQNMGVAFFNLEGGEPFLVFEKLKKVCAVIDERSEIWINSTGDGMTVERLIELKKMGLTALMFSLHTSVPEELNAFMRSNEAWKKLETGVKYCHEANVPVAFNICLQKQDFYNGKFERVIEKAKEFNAAIIQLIKPKPAGGWLESGVEEFSKTDMVHIKNLVNRYNLKKEFEEYPSISAQIIEESENMFGCTAGGTDRFYINAK
ncbi:MAG: radical SAM protein, partial [Calditrichia bacterium]|nr:radical SAM protein [Calditrichia bacterium]